MIFRFHLLQIAEFTEPMFSGEIFYISHALSLNCGQIFGKTLEFYAIYRFLPPEGIFRIWILTWILNNIQILTCCLFVHTNVNYLKVRCMLNLISPHVRKSQISYITLIKDAQCFLAVFLLVISRFSISYTLSCNILYISESVLPRSFSQNFAALSLAITDRGNRPSSPYTA